MFAPILTVHLLEYLIHDQKEACTRSFFHVFVSWFCLLAYAYLSTAAPEIHNELVFYYLDRILSIRPQPPPPSAPRLTAGMEPGVLGETRSKLIKFLLVRFVVCLFYKCKGFFFFFPSFLHGKVNPMLEFNDIQPREDAFAFPVKRSPGGASDPAIAHRPARAGAHHLRTQVARRQDGRRVRVPFCATFNLSLCIWLQF